MTQYELVKGALEQSAKGVTTEQLSQKTRLNTNQLYKIVSRLRSDGLKVPFVDGKYILQANVVGHDIQSSPQVPTPHKGGARKGMIKGGNLHKVLIFLRNCAAAGGANADDICKAGFYDNRASAQCAIMDLRSHGFRVDTVEGKYVFRGKGQKSLCTVKGCTREILSRSTRRSQSPKNHGGHRLIAKSSRPLPQSSSLSQGAQLVQQFSQRASALAQPVHVETPVQAPVPKVVPSEDIVVINYDLVKEAMNLLTPEHQEDFTQVLNRAKVYNKAIKDIIAARSKLPDLPTA